MAVNAQFFRPYPAEPNGGTNLVGFAASEGKVYAPFDDAPAQSYAIVANAPGLNIGADNAAQLVLRGPTAGSLVSASNTAVAVTPYNTVTGSARIIAAGVITIPTYNTSGPLYRGTSSYTNTNSWYDTVTARTAVGLSEDGRTLYLFTVDAAGGSSGMTVPQVADFLKANFHVHNALNLDGGGSTTLAMADPASGVGSVVNVPSNPGRPRAVRAAWSSSPSRFPRPKRSPYLVVAIAVGFAGAARRERNICPMTFAGEGNDPVDRNNKRKDRNYETLRP